MNYNEEVSRLKSESKLYLYAGYAVMLLVIGVIVYLSDLQNTGANAPTRLQSFNAPPVAPMASSELDICSKIVHQDIQTAQLCRVIGKLKHEKIQGESDLRRLRQDPALLKEEYKRDVEMIKNNAEINATERKNQLETTLSRDRFLAEQTRWESMMKIVGFSFWRVTLILFGFYVVRVLFQRSNAASDRSHYFTNLAILTKLPHAEAVTALKFIHLSIDKNLPTNLLDAEKSASLQMQATDAQAAKL